MRTDAVRTRPARSSRRRGPLLIAGTLIALYLVVAVSRGAQALDRETCWDRGPQILADRGLSAEPEIQRVHDDGWSWLTLSTYCSVALDHGRLEHWTVP